MILPSPFLQTTVLDPVRAEIAVGLSSWPLQPGDEVRGKLVGPQCLYASTVEVAYPLRQSSAGYHFLIPEPSLWEPDTPFVYTGRIELWRGGNKEGERKIHHALYHLTRTAAGARLNGRSIELRVVESAQAADLDWPNMRQRGYNAARLVERDDAAEMFALRIGILPLNDAS